MNARPSFDIDTSGFRRGQLLAHDITYDRILNKERYTAIVLPTRYGKTDFIRVTGLRLWRDGLASSVLIMSPNRILRDQAMRPDKFAECFARYNIHIPQPRVYTVDGSLKPEWLRGSVFVSITTQMAMMRIKELSQWVEHMEYRDGSPPVVFIDEAHTGSEKNTWGGIAKQLKDAGANIVLATATPFRADHLPIVGFETIVESVKPVRFGNRAIDIWQGNKVTRRLTAHHVTTFGEAWAEDPPVLCKIVRQPFEITGDRLERATGELHSGAVLSKIDDPLMVRAILRTATRDPIVIADGVTIMVKEIERRRKDPNGSATSAIVFVGNDDQDVDEVSNQHAKDVEAAIKKVDRDLRCVIATNDNPDAQNAIENFVSGKYDVLIVKQMAGVGLDVDHLKVCLDLSNTRTPGAFIQRMMRIATPLRVGDNVAEWVTTCTYIAPDDCLQAAIFQQFITDEGGGWTVSTIEDVEYIGPSDGEGRAFRLSGDAFLPTGTALPDTFDDSDKVTARGEMIPVADAFMDQAPEVARVLSKAKLAAILDDLGAASNGTGHLKSLSPEKETNPEPVIYDIEKEFQSERKRASRLLNEVAKAYFFVNKGRRYRGRHDSEEFGETVKQITNRHKRRVGAPLGRRLEDFTDIEQVRTMCRNLTEELKELSNG